MTRTDLQQDVLQDMVSEKDTGVGCVERAGGSPTDTVLPPIDSSPTPIPARGNPSTNAPKTRKSILRDMQDKLSAWFRDEIYLSDEDLDFITTTLGSANHDSNLPSLTKTADSAPPDTLIGGCPNFSIPTSLPQNTHFTQANHDFHSGDGKMYKGFHFGGYDGQTEIGIEGYWLLDCLEKICKFLERLKIEAGENPDGMAEGEFCGYKVLVSVSGAKEGLYYRYRIQVDGVTILIHHNPPKNRQPARVRFSAESLMVNLAPAVWQRVRNFFAVIGFVVTKAVPSRVDLQVTTDSFSMSHFVDLLKKGHVVTRLRKQSVYGDNVFGGDVGTVSFGSGSSPVQITVYDKWKELHSGGNSLTQKYVLNLQKMGDDWVNSGRPVTRVEIRINRDGLKNMGIDTIDDLFGNEWAIINLITQNWFRILAEPKKKGNEWKQKNHPVWDRIRSLFRLYFPDGHDDAKAEWNPPEPVACDPVSLEKQALGCLSKASAVRYGEQATEHDSMMAAVHILNHYKGKDSLHYKTNTIAKHTQIKTGIPLGLRVEESWETIDPAVLDRSRKQANEWIKPQSVGASAPEQLSLDLLVTPPSDGVADVSSVPSPVRGNGEALDLDGVTGVERWDDFMKKTEKFHMRE